MSVKISELPILDSLADNDVIAGVDTSANVTSKIEMATLKNYIDTNTQYTAGTNIDITNNVVSAPNVYNKTETDAMLEEKDEQIEELQSEVDSLSTIFNAFPTESGEGESVTLDDTAEVKFKKFDLKGNTSQTTYSGINLFEPKLVSTTRNGITITNNGDGSFTFNQTATANVDARLDQSTPTGNDNLKDYNGTYTLSCENLPSSMRLVVMQYGTYTSIATLQNATSVTFTTNTDDCFIYVYVPSGTTLNNVTIRPMIEKGSTVSPYQPYVGGIASPNPSYPQPVNVVSGDNEINVCGKNLIGLGTQKNGYRRTNDGTFLEANTNSIGYYFPTQSLPNTITFNCTDGNRANISYYNQVPSEGVVSQDYSYSNTLPRTISVNKNYKYIHIQFSYLQDVSNVMINEGSSASTYEPYQGNTYNIDLPVENLFEGVFEEGGWDIGNGEKQYAPGRNRCPDLIAVKPSTTYTIGFENAGTCYVLEYGSNSNFLTYSQVSYRTYNGSFTTGANTRYITFYYIPYNHDFTLNEKCQLEVGSKANTYTPYGTTPIELCKIGNYQDYIYKSGGKNLLDTDSMVMGDLQNDTGNEIPNTNRTHYRSGFIKVLPNTQYTFTTNYTYPSNSVTKLMEYDNGESFIRRNSASSTNKIITFTTASNTNYLRIVMYSSSAFTDFYSLENMVAKGNDSTYEPYGVKGKWCVRKKTGKIVLDGTQNITLAPSGVRRFNASYTALGIDNIKSGNTGLETQTNYRMCDHFYYKAGETTWGIHYLHQNWLVLFDSNSVIASENDLKNWLTNNPTTIYYVLETPTANEVEYQPLIDQLNELEKAMSKDGQTNISQVNNDLGFVIYAEAIKSLENVLDRLDLLES